jgi:hypothetical protein
MNSPGTAAVAAACWNAATGAANAPLAGTAAAPAPPAAGCEKALLPKAPPPAPPWPSDSPANEPPAGVAAGVPNAVVAAGVSNAGAPADAAAGVNAPKAG